MKRAAGGLFLLLLTSGIAQASPITFTFYFPEGFNVSINDGELTPSGPITVTATVDDGAPDLNADPTYGQFATTSVVFTGAGFVDEPVTSSLSLLTGTWATGGAQAFALQLLGQVGIAPGSLGWNGVTAGGPFMTDVNDLSTLFGLPYTTSGTSTFWYDALGAKAYALASGDTVGAYVANNGGTGTFSIDIGTPATVPEPTTLLLLGTGLGAVAARRRRGKRA